MEAKPRFSVGVIGLNRLTLLIKRHRGFSIFERFQYKAVQHHGFNREIVIEHFQRAHLTNELVIRRCEILDRVNIFVEHQFADRIHANRLDAAQLDPFCNCGLCVQVCAADTRRDRVRVKTIKQDFIRLNANTRAIEIINNREVFNPGCAATLIQRNRSGL